MWLVGANNSLCAALEAIAIVVVKTLLEVEADADLVVMIVVAVMRVEMHSLIIMTCCHVISD